MLIVTGKIYLEFSAHIPTMTDFAEMRRLIAKEPFNLTGFRGHLVLS
ncbi:hypothetical protein PC116_g28971 [Phytophthora cactorum]|nr:hypothetical protein PC116_g28971 [Phytophthora cactorum]